MYKGIIYTHIYEGHTLSPLFSSPSPNFLHPPSHEPSPLHDPLQGSKYPTQTHSLPGNQFNVLDKPGYYDDGGVGDLQVSAR